MFDIWKKASEGDGNVESLTRKQSKEREIRQRSKRGSRVFAEFGGGKMDRRLDEFTERVYFEHSETGEIVWDEKPVRGFITKVSV